MDTMTILEAVEILLPRWPSCRLIKVKAFFMHSYGGIGRRGAKRRERAEQEGEDGGNK